MALFFSESKLYIMKNLVIFVLGLAIGGSVVYFMLNSSSIESGNGNSIETGPKNINAIEADKLFRTYHDSQKDKLKVTVTDEAGNSKVENIKTFTIQQEIITYFDGLVKNAINEDPSLEAAGLAFTLGRDDNNSSTLIITALVSKPSDKKSGDRKIEHLLPKDDQDKSYIYDHIDICPHDCPSNSFPLTEEEYEENENDSIPPYDSDNNYWVRKN